MIITASEFFQRPANVPQHVEDAFFSSIRNCNRTFKCTRRDRFADLDRHLIDVLRDRFQNGPSQVLDTGVSSGTTTLDLQAAFAKAGFCPRITGTDLALHAKIVPLGKRCSALVSDDGHLMQVDIGGIAVRPWPRRLDVLSGMRLVRPWVRRWAERRLQQTSAHIVAQRVLLVSPRLENHPSISIVEDNILVRRKAFEARFDVIRAANILNHGYFRPEELQRALSNLKSYLAGPGALLLVARTMRSGEHHGTLFELGDQRRLRVLHRYGNGSEVESIALGG